MKYTGCFGHQAWGPRIIEAGAQVNLQTEDGDTSLHLFERVLENDIKTYHAP